MLITDIQQGLAIFDGLPPVRTQFLIGRWRGFEIQKNHPMSGLLENSGWYGKEFNTSDNVHPLLFSVKGKVFPINPKYIPLSSNLYKTLPRSKMFSALTKLFKTKKPKAKLKILTYRNKETTAMVYNDKPITDFFAKIDDNQVLGVMITPQIEPYFFLLKRIS